MSVRFDNTIKYFDRFSTPVPRLYMQHLSDEAYNARIVKALQENIPIDPEEFMPPMTYHDDGTPKVFI